VSAVASRDVLRAVDPATGDLLRELPAATEADVDAAVTRAEHAHRTHEGWRHPAERARVLHAIARGIEDRANQLAELETKDTGKPIAQGRADVQATVRYFDYYAGAADKLHGESIPLGPGHVDYTVREPWGVCGQIIPWNYPLQVTARCAAPALAAGNAVVLKPSELACITPVELAATAYERGLPDGLLQVVTGLGDAGAALVGHPKVAHVTFVGSPTTGEKVLHAAAPGLKPVELELGGKSPNLVFADADLDRAIPAIVNALVQNAGQSCSAGTRLLVETPVYDEVLERVAAAFAALTIGPGIDGAELGPLISRPQLERAVRMLETAKAHGATFITGGGRPEHLPHGHYLEPTLIKDADPASELWNEEVFGPVLAARPFSTDSEAAELANGSPYGLVAGLWTQDVSRAHQIAAALQAGQVYVNTYGVGGGVELPFGGYKRSGYGRGKGLEAIRSYTQLKNVCVAV
jgi:aldehyde dehydrogenase (NAD+)